MPDGTIVQDVPDDITQTELLRRFNAYQGSAATDETAHTPDQPVRVGDNGVPPLQTQAQLDNPLPDHPAQAQPPLSNDIPVATPFGSFGDDVQGMNQRPATWQETIQSIPDRVAGTVKQSIGGVGQMMSPPLEKDSPQPTTPEEQLSDALDTPLLTRANRALGELFPNRRSSPLNKVVNRLNERFNEKSRGLSERGRTQIEASTPPNQTFWQQAFSSGMESAAQTVPAMGAFALTRNPQFSSRFLIGQFGVQEAGRAFDEAKSQGLPDDEAYRHAAISGIAEAGTEMLPAKVLFSKDPNALKRVINFFAAELPGENIAELTQMASEWAHGLRDDVTIKDIVDTVKLTSAATLIGGGAQVTASHYLNKLGDQIDNRLIERAANQQIEQANLGDADAQARASMQPDQTLAPKDVETGKNIPENIPEVKETTTKPLETGSKSVEEVPEISETPGNTIDMGAHLEIAKKDHAKLIKTKTDEQQFSEGFTSGFDDFAQGTKKDKDTLAEFDKTYRKAYSIGQDAANQADAFDDGQALTQEESEAIEKNKEKNAKSDLFLQGFNQLYKYYSPKELIQFQKEHPNHYSNPDGALDWLTKKLKEGQKRGPRKKPTKPVASKTPSKRYYRAEGFAGGAPKGATAADVIRYEAEAGKEIPESVIKNIKQYENIPATDLVWVGTDKQAMMDEYGPDEISGFEGMIQSEEDIGDVTEKYKNWSVLAEDDSGTLLIRKPVKKSKPVASKVVDDSGEIESIREAWDKYDDTGEITHEDLVDEIEAIAEDSSTQNVQSLLDAVSDYRKEQEEDRELGGRGDMDSAEERFNEAVNKILDNNKPVASKPVASKSGPGSNYVGHRDELYKGANPNAEKFDKPLPDKPIRREDVIKPFLKALGVPLYQGKSARIKGGSVLGYYHPTNEAVRIKHPMNIETTAHELAHYIDDAVFGGFQKGSKPVAAERGLFNRIKLPMSKKEIPQINGRPWKGNPTYTRELKSVSYDESKTFEGFAEYVRLWMTQPNEASSAAPEFTQWWENFVNTHPIGPALKNAKQGMLSWFEQGELGKLASKVGYADEVNDILAGLKDRVRQAAMDDLHGLYRMERDLTQQVAPAGPYETARLIRSSDAILEGALTLGVPVTHRDGTHSFEGDSLMDLLKPVSNEIDKFFLYSIAKRANRLRGEGKERWFSRSEIEAGLKLENPTFKKVHAAYQKWNSGMLDFAQSKGLIDPESRALWEKADYIPFHRVDNTPGGNKKGMLGNVSVIKQLKGGEANIRPPLENIILNARMLVKNALQNEARIKIVNLANKARGGGRYLRKIPKEAGYTSVSKNEIFKYLQDKLEITPQDEERQGIYKRLMEKMADEFEQAPDFIKFLTLGNAPTGQQVFAVMNKGKPVFYEVADPLLWRSLTAFNRPPITNEVIRFMAAVRRIGQTTITLTPDFVAANIARDTLMASIFSRHGFKPFKDSIKGMASRIKQDDNYRLAIANGVGFSSYYTDDTAFRKHLERFYTDKGWDAKTVLDTPSKMFYAIERFADAFEMSARLGEFQRARDAGQDLRHAAYLGREVSTDFSMRGDSRTLNFMYDTVMFLKAGVNGLDRGYRGFAHDPNRGTIAAKTAVLAGLSAMLYLINRDNPLYEETEDWEKDTYWHFFIPTKEYYDYYQQHGQKPQPGTPEDAAKYFDHFRYPKIWEIGAIASVAERSFEQIANLADEKRDASAGKLAADTVRVMGDLFKLNVTPQAMHPLFEQLANENFFTNRPIETKGMENLPQWMRAKQSTSGTLKKLGELTRNFPEAYQLPPARAEALLRGYFNTWAMYGLTISDALFFDKSVPVDQYPVIRRFYKEHPSRYNKYTNEFYELLKETSELRSGYSKLESGGQYELAEEYAEKQREDEYQELYRLNKDIGEIHKDMRLITNDPDMSEKKKSREIEKLQIQKNVAMRELVEAIKQERRER